MSPSFMCAPRFPPAKFVRIAWLPAWPRLFELLGQSRRDAIVAFGDMIALVALAKDPELIVGGFVADRHEQIQGALLIDFQAIFADIRRPQHGSRQTVYSALFKPLGNT